MAMTAHRVNPRALESVLQGVRSSCGLFQLLSVVVCASAGCSIVPACHKLVVHQQHLRDTCKLR